MSDVPLSDHQFPESSQIPSIRKPTEPQKMTSSPFEIRPAVPEDWEVIADLNTRLAAETEGLELVPAVIGAGVRELLKNPHYGRYFVAVSAGRVIGQIMHTSEWSDWRNGEIWWLQSVYVHPDFRQQGVFRQLHAYLEELARCSPTVIGLRLYAEQSNSNALSVYHSLGLEQTGYIVLERFLRNSLQKMERSEG
jgi:GNAT superfamily N-acetyltransferase